jgi:heterodisulfide reductase subunit A
LKLKELLMADKVLVIGGGPGGLEAARLLSAIGTPCILVEARPVLGGMPKEANYAALTHGFHSADDLMGRIVDEVKASSLVDIRLNTAVTACTGESGNFTVTLAGQGNGKGEQVNVGSIIVATGFQHFDPGRETQIYGYYEYPDVITIADAEGMLKEHKFLTSTGKVPERVAFIQCVGSRDRQIGNEYCSKVCCGISSKQAIEIRQMHPETRVFIFYIDMRMYGYWENEIYWPAQEQHHVNYVKGIITEIIKKGDRLVVRGEDTTMGRPMEVEMDMVVLAVGMEASKGTREVSQILGLKQNKYNFIDVPHDALDPTATTVPGIFVAGAAAGPKDLDDTMSMAGAAAAKATGVVRALNKVTA